MYIYNQKFFILGISKSGFSVAKYLLQNDCTCFVFDESQSEKIKKNIEILVENGAKKVEQGHWFEFLVKADVLVLSPGIPINHPVAVSAKKEGKRIIGELELGFSFFNPTSVAVTGTNGKTTTVSMINEVLNSAKKSSVLVGNVGVPVTEKIEEIKKDTICVTEVSSFQLETINSLCPHISCVLNVTPDHLERHYTMENYVYLKKRLLKNLKESEYAVLNYDDEIVKDFIKDTKAKVIYVSCKEKIDGAYLFGDDLCYKDQIIMQKSCLPIGGIHNCYNALFTIAVCKILGLENEDIAKGLSEFKGVKHRLELVAQKNNVKFFNDSKSTNTASAITAIDTMKSDTVLILGGSEKGEDYTKLFKKIKSSFVKHTIITGASRYKMLSYAINENVTDISVISEFESAVKVATSIAKEGDCVLLSPACASFDWFSGYEERGDKFVKILENILE